MRTEYSGITGTSVYIDITGSAGGSFSSADFEYSWEPLNTPWSAPDDTWQCNYCGTAHWIEDRQLQCSKCGGPRDV